MNTLDYIEALKGLTETRSAYAVAKLIGVDEDTVRGWEKGRTFPTVESCIVIAQKLHLDWPQVVADIRLEASKGKREREVWEKIAGKAAAALSGICLISLLNSGGNWAADRSKMLYGTFSKELGGSTTHICRTEKATTKRRINYARLVAVTLRLLAMVQRWLAGENRSHFHRLAAG